MLARIALLTVGVFLLAVFVLDRAKGLPRSTLVMAPLFQMLVCIGIRIARRALHEHALESFSPLRTITERIAQSPSLLLIGPRPWPTPTYAMSPAATITPTRPSASSAPTAATWASRCGRRLHPRRR